MNNADAIAAWNTVLFNKFVTYRPLLVEGLGSHGARAIERARPVRGERVVDLGCGFGDTTIELARRTGSAVGLDAAARFIEVARDEARGVPGASFLLADIEAVVPGGPYDLAYSRMGTMFFASPVRALRNVREALVPGGRLCMVVWRSKAANECMAVAEAAVRARLGDREKGEHLTCGPGPFSMASPDVVSEQLVAAGYRDITFERSDADLAIGATLEAAVAFALDMGPAGELVRLAGDEGVARRGELEAAIREALGPFVTANGVRAGSSTWIVSAVRP